MNVGGCIHLRQYLVLPLGTMTVLEALAILESATLECKQRDINTPEVSEAMNLLESYIWPKWLILQFRHNLDGEFAQIEFTEWTQDGHLGHSKFVRLRDDRGDRDLVGGLNTRDDLPRFATCLLSRLWDNTLCLQPRHSNEGGNHEEAFRDDFGIDV
jgi:hypothetical protein